jgi:hypothetical protein
MRCGGKDIDKPLLLRFSLKALAYNIPEMRPTVKDHLPPQGWHILAVSPLEPLANLWRFAVVWHRQFSPVRQ